MKTISKYKNEIRMCFDEKGSGFSLDVPHYTEWRTLIRFLRLRGFKVRQNDWYKKQYSCLSRYHKIGFKKNVACLMEISAKGIQIEFGHIKAHMAKFGIQIDSPSQKKAA